MLQLVFSHFPVCTCYQCLVTFSFLKRKSYQCNGMFQLHKSIDRLYQIQRVCTRCFILSTFREYFISNAEIFQDLKGRETLWKNQDNLINVIQEPSSYQQNVEILIHTYKLKCISNPMSLKNVETCIVDKNSFEGINVFE